MQGRDAQRVVTVNRLRDNAMGIMDTGWATKERRWKSEYNVRQLLHCQTVLHAAVL